jgi:hypothetical protein
METLEAQNDEINVIQSVVESTIRNGPVSEPPNAKLEDIRNQLYDEVGVERSETISEVPVNTEEPKLEEEETGLVQILLRPWDIANLNSLNDRLRQARISES